MALARETTALARRGGTDPYGDTLMRAVAAALSRLEQIALAARRGINACPEIDCLRGRLPPGAISRAVQRAQALNVGADEVLVTQGLITREAYCRALAKYLGMRFVNLDGLSRRDCPASPDLLLRAPNAGMLPLLRGTEPLWAIAPRGLAARHLINLARKDSDLRQRTLITSPEHMSRFVHRCVPDAIAWESTERLRTTEPLLSAGTRGWRGRLIALTLLSCLAGALAFAPGPSLLVIQVFVSVVFFAWSALRMVTLVSRRTAPETEPSSLSIAGRDLPTYTVLVAAYREAAALPDLVEALRALDYPAEKLSIILVLEPDDWQTHDAVAALRLGPQFELIVAPAAGPRTKPKALNAALPFARGELTVVFDAEDTPEPDQLRRAAATFMADDSGRLACLQARLTIDNTDDSWLAGLFTAEYAGLFDVMLPGLGARGLPIPLGGSSNHFRTRILREVAGWDAHNVTEDADIGTRLARRGYRIGVLQSSTYEEAPAKPGPWLRQRTRWLKGWMQTWSVHMRRPLCLLREMGPAGFATFQLLFIGTVVAALLQPLAWLLIFVAMVGDWLPADHPDLAWFHLSALAGGYAVSMALAIAGLARRRLGRLTYLMPLMIGHWVLLSVAAWRAAAQLLRDPYRWDKTEHGVGRTSRRIQPSRSTDSAAVQSPLLRDAA